MSATRWVREGKLSEMTGLSKDAIKHLRCKWVEGRQWKKGPDGVYWYNHGEIDRWVETGRAA